MFKVSSKFGAAFLALSLTAIISILAACGESSDAGGTEVISSSSNGKVDNKEPPSDTLEVFNVSANLLDQNTLYISGQIKIKVGELASYWVKLEDGTEVIPKTTPSDPQLVEFSKNVTLTEGQCCHETESFDAQVFFTMKDVAGEFNKAASFRRNYPACLPKVSSSSVSSSSVKQLEFKSITTSPVSLKGGGGEARGISFGSSITVQDGAVQDCVGHSWHICYAAPTGTSNGSIIAGTGVKLLTTFNPCQGTMSYKDPTSDPDYVHCEFNNPKEVSKFQFFANSFITEPLGYNQSMYFMVRTNAGAPENQWATTDYLVAFIDEAPTGTTGSLTYPKTIKIVAWKVE